MRRSPRSKREARELLGRIVQSELNRAEGGEDDKLQAERRRAMAYYFAMPRGDEVQDRSQVISTDVADMVNATLAMLVPMLSTDAVVEFEPLGEEDEVQAKAESDAVNALVVEDNRGFLEIQEAVKDALLLKNGCMKIHVDEKVDVVRYDVGGLANEQLAALLVQRSPNETRTLNDDMTTLTVSTTTRRFEINAVPIENISYQAAYTGHFQDIRFFAERIDYTRSELLEMGVDRKLVQSLPAMNEPRPSTSAVRDQSHEEGWDAETADQDMVSCHEAYILTDLDNDGISERYKVLVANGSVCLDYEQVDLIPYALGSPFVNPHRLTGESLADHLMSIQDTKTALLRQWLDNVSIINNGRYVYDPSQTAEEDVLTPKAGGGIRSRNPMQAVVPVPTLDVSAGILAGLTYQDQLRTERGGASLEMLSADKQLVGETAHGIERQYASREAMATMMAANLSETLIRGIYVLTHEFLRRYALEPMMVRISGTYQQIDPREWPKRNRVNIKTGMSPGQRGHLQNTLAMNMQMQLGIMQAGGGNTLADMTTLYRTAIDWLRMAGVSNPERLWIDPTSPKAQQAGQIAQQQTQAAQAKQDELLRTQIAIKLKELEEEARQHDGDLAHKYYDTNVDAQVAGMRVGAEGAIDLQKTRMTTQAHIESARKRSKAAKVVGGSE